MVAGTGADVGTTVVGAAVATVVTPMVDAAGKVPLAAGPAGRTVVTFGIDTDIVGDVERPERLQGRTVVTFGIDTDGTTVVGVTTDVGMRDETGATTTFTTEPGSSSVPGAGSIRVMTSGVHSSVKYQIDRRPQVICAWMSMMAFQPVEAYTTMALLPGTRAVLDDALPAE